MKRLLWSLLLASCLSFPGISLANTGLTSDDMAQFMRGMASMARLWNTFSGNYGSFSPPSGFAWPPNPWLEAWGGRQPAKIPGYLSSWNGPSGPSPTAGYLDGIWEGLSGERVFLRDNRFIIQNPTGQALHGFFMTYANRLIVYCVESDTVCLFRFNLREPMLTVQSPSGDILLFNRLARNESW